MSSTSTFPEGNPEAEIERRVSAEVAASAEPAREGHLMRLWKPPTAAGENAGAR